MRPRWPNRRRAAISGRRPLTPGADAGEALWPEAYPVRPERIRRNSQPRLLVRALSAAASPGRGRLLGPEWLKPYTKAPPLDTMRVYGGSDYAVTADGGDYTVHAVVGLQTPRGGCTSIYGANRLPRMCGLRRSAISSCNGSR